MSTRFFTNENENTLLQKFRGVFENNKDIYAFDALVGYFRATGYFQIRPFLNDVQRVRILVGINVDKILEKYQSRGLLFRGDAEQTLTEFLADSKKDIQEAGYSDEIESGIQQFLQDICSGKIEIKAHPSKKLHAKIYIFRPENWNEHRPGHVITGSSNLTEPGLGTGDHVNYEFNVILNDYTDVHFANQEFEKLWEEGIPILPVEAEKLKKETYLNTEFTPFEIYIKLLIEYFGKSVEFDPNSIRDLPEGFKKLSYQIDAVNEGYKLLQKHNGFFLSDVVGLGKTVVGVLIARQFFYSNGFPSHISNVLIVVPPSLQDNWEETLKKFQFHNYKIVTNGSLHKITDAEKYDLVIVDEAHKFRNDNADAYNSLQKICKTKTKRLLKDGINAAKKVILISATPLNNRPEDIANQVYLFQDSKDSTLDGVSNLQHFFRQRIDEFNRLKANTDIGFVQNGVKKIYDEIRNKVIAPLTVRRTRSDLAAHEQYRSDLIAQQIKFPDVEKPRKILYQLGDSLDALYDRTMRLLSHETEGVKYYRYQAIKFLRGGKKSKYKNADAASAALARIMKTMLVKRIDSSFFAFKASLNRFTVATAAMIRMFEQGVVFIAPRLNVTEYITEGREDELMARILEIKDIDPAVEICSPSDFVPEFLDILRRDYDILSELNKHWESILEDPKLDEFLHRVNTELFSNKINHSGKLVIFSESKETSGYIASCLRRQGRTDVLEVNSETRNSLRETIRLNFDANIPQNQYAHDYNIIISTEVLAEGVNLHRSNVIVNYDTPWNSTKLMQRIGRVNRIGSDAPAIFIYNFYPTSRVNNDIELEKRAIMKLQAFHAALGEDSEIYSPDEETQSFGLFDKNPEAQEDLKLNFLMELRSFKADNPEYFRKIKNMPLRARAGRKERTKRDTTICFIRNERRDAFYWIREDGTAEEMTFIEVANEFKADRAEKSIPLHNQHHNQVMIAVNAFNDKIQEEITRSQVADTTQGPNELKALNFLDGFLAVPFISTDEVSKIKAAKQAIRQGKFQQLQREVNALKRNSRKTPVSMMVLLDMAIRLINKYPVDLSDNGDYKPLISIRSFEKLKPEIIISESFAFNK